MLNCIAIYRGMDKKPYGNILKEPEFAELCDSSVNLEGGAVMSAFEKFSTPVSKLIERNNAGIAKRFGVHATSASASVISDTIDSHSIAFMAKYSGQGKHLAPLPGDRHRITGLIQRKPVTYGRETLSQASRAIIIPAGRCNA